MPASDPSTLRTDANSQHDEGTSRRGSLYVVATPIGNLSDIGQRAADCLRQVRWVAAEDTRVTRVLLERIGSAAQTFSAHQHNETAAGRRIVECLDAGDDVALVSDAGTPAVSDPGSVIVAAVRAAGASVVPIPGPSAPTTLLSAAGLAPGPFLFDGFLPPRPKARDQRLAMLRGHADALGAHVVLFEGPHRIERTLTAIGVIHGPDRTLAIGRELTKMFEQIVVVRSGEARAWLDSNPDHRRGEFVLAIAAKASGKVGGLADSHSPSDLSQDDTGNPADGQDDEDIAAAESPVDSHVYALAAPMTPLLSDPRKLMSRLLRDLSPSRAVKLAVELTGLAHRDLYALALELKRDDDDEPAR